VAFTCPRCQRASHHPEDERQGYCAACGGFTGSGNVCECGQCGTRSVVPPLHAGAVWCPCGAPEPMHRLRVPAPAMIARLTALPAVREPTGDWQCPGCGLRLLAPPDCSLLTCPPCFTATGRLVFMTRAWRCEAPGVSSRQAADGFERMRELMSARPASRQNSGALITGSLAEESADRQDEVDDCSYSDSMRWLPGDAEW
jgi:hypothetical protein